MRDRLLFLHNSHRVCAMQSADHPFDFDETGGESFRQDAAESLDSSQEPKSPEDAADRFGVRAALLVLCVGFAIAAMWLVTGPSFEKCSALENLAQRNACYDALRNDLFKPPAKGGDLRNG
jgi:hypothetical protein